MKNEFIAPSERENELYDPLQIYHVSQLEKLRMEVLQMLPQKTFWQDVLKDQSEEIENKFKGFESIFELLQKIRYFYVPEITGILSIRNRTSTVEAWEKERATFDPKALIYDNGVSNDEIEKWRIDLFSEGQYFDPLKSPDWHSFLKAVRRSEPQRYEHLGGYALLAQDYYLMAEMLSKLLEEITGRAAIPIEDLFDAQVGKWREAKCQKCGNAFQRHSRKERFCSDCKKDIAKTLKGGWVCKKCEALLHKYADNDELLITVFPQAKKEHQLDVYLRLEYGVLMMKIQCPKCGEVNVKRIEQGWWE